MVRLEVVNGNVSVPGVGIMDHVNIYGMNSKYFRSGRYNLQHWQKTEKGYTPHSVATLWVNAEPRRAIKENLSKTEPFYMGKGAYELFLPLGFPIRTEHKAETGRDRDKIHYAKLQTFRCSIEVKEYAYSDPVGQVHEWTVGEWLPSELTDFGRETERLATELWVGGLAVPENLGNIREAYNLTRKNPPVYIRIVDDGEDRFTDNPPSNQSIEVTLDEASRVREWLWRDSQRSTAERTVLTPNQNFRRQHRDYWQQIKDKVNAL